jgi:4-amino-4-deoxy-L-arabinose transferase-like glycosyltransferase
VFAWLFAGEVLPGRRAARAGLVTAIALQPMLAHQFALVNNDGWVIAAGFAALWVAARLVRAERAPWLMLAAGAIAGLGALGKPFAGLMVIPIALGWLLGKIRYRVRDWKVLIGEPALAAVGVAATYGVWLVAARVLGIDTGLGFPEGAQDGPRDLLTYARTQLSPDLAEFRQLWVDQLWGNFGWVNTPLPFGAQQVIWFLYLALALTVLIWLVVLVRERRAGVVDAAVRDIDRWIALCVLSGLGVLAGMYAVEYGFFASTGLTNLLQGRYLLNVVPALLALPPLLAERLSRRRPAATVAAWTMAAGVLALHVTGVLVIAQKYYL